MPSSRNAQYPPVEDLIPTHSFSASDTCYWRRRPAWVPRPRVPAQQSPDQWLSELSDKRLRHKHSLTALCAQVSPANAVKPITDEADIKTRRYNPSPFVQYSCAIFRTPSKVSLSRVKSFSPNMLHSLESPLFQLFPYFSWAWRWWRKVLALLHKPREAVVTSPPLSSVT